MLAISLLSASLSRSGFYASLLSSLRWIAVEIQCWSAVSVLFGVRKRRLCWERGCVLGRALAFVGVLRGGRICGGGGGGGIAIGVLFLGGWFVLGGMVRRGVS